MSRDEQWDDWHSSEKEPGPRNVRPGLLQHIPALTDQRLLAERRSLCLELARESDPIARGLIEFQIADIDRALAPKTEAALSVLRAGGLL